MCHQSYLKPSITMNSRGSLQGCKGNTCREASSLSIRLSSLLARATSSCTRPVRSPSLFLASSICKPQGVTPLRKYQAYLCYICCKAVLMRRSTDRGAASMSICLRDCLDWCPMPLRAETHAWGSLSGQPLHERRISGRSHRHANLCVLPCMRHLVELGGCLSGLPIIDGVLQAAALLVDLLEARQLLALLLQLLQPRLQLLHLLGEVKMVLDCQPGKLAGALPASPASGNFSAKGVQPVSPSVNSYLPLTFRRASRHPVGGAHTGNLGEGPW